MKKWFYYLIGMGCMVCCNTEMPTTNVPDQTTVSSKKQIDTSSIIAFNEEEEAIDVLQESSNITRANLFDWEGSIDRKYPIRLSFEWKKTPRYERSNLGESIKLEGHYSYKKEGKEIVLKGEWNRSNNQIQLKVYKDSILDEEFEGQFVSSFKPIVGNWTKVRKNKVLPFELKPVVTYETTQIFANRLEELLLGQDVERLYAESVGVDEFGIYIEELEAWNPYWTLSNSFFDGSTSYNAEMRASDYQLLLDIKRLSTSKEVLIWERESASGVSKGYFDKDEVYQEPEESEESDYQYDTISILCYHKGDFIDILVDTTTDFRVIKQDSFEVIKQNSTQKKWRFSSENSIFELME